MCVFDESSTIFSLNYSVGLFIGKYDILEFSVVGTSIALCDMHKRYVNLFVVLLACAIFTSIGADGYISSQNVKVS